jgi:nucleotide-binding universal stress UspA family protein
MKRFKNILFLADGDDAGSAALLRAMALAKSNQARLTLFDVVEPVDTPRRIREKWRVDITDVLRQQRREILAQLIQPFEGDDELTYTEVVSGIPFIEVIRAVQRNGYDLVIKGASPPSGIAGRLFGSTDLHLLRKCPCPVWIERLAANERYKRVLAAVDPASSDPRMQKVILELATSLAAREKAELHVVHAWNLDGESTLRNGRFRLPEPEVREMLDILEAQHREELDLLLQPYGLSSDSQGVELLKGEAAPVIRRTAASLGADLIILGTIGRSGIPGFFIGNTAEEVLQDTQAAVLAVKPEDFVSPVS